jgi:tRNA(Ile)-lysidine synthase
MLLQQFHEHINNKNYFNSNTELLLAVSGGKDSMVLADLLIKSNLSFTVVHCNFCLRAEEADRDEEFVTNYFNQKGINVYTKKFSTYEYAQKNNLSIQMAARELRYNWFNELIIEHKFEFLVTAHHLNDAIETFFINLLRGTGINGLKGIPEKQGNIIRPLLFASTELINNYQKENTIPFVEDSSNRETKYLRNQLRHQLIPLLKSVNPEIENTFKKELSIFYDTAKYVEFKIIQDLSSITKAENNQFIIKISELIQSPFLDLILHHLLKQYHFSPDLNPQLKTMILNPETGKKIVGSRFSCLIDRECIIFKENITTSYQLNYLINKEDLNVDFPISLKLVHHLKPHIIKSAHVGCFDMDKLSFPLQLRKWEKGDFYYPIGINGKKKLSDFFVNNKYSEFEKKEQWLLTSNNQIVWIIGKRIDRRFMVTDLTKETLEIKLNDPR